MEDNIIKSEENGIKIISLRCPNCDQSLEVDGDLDTYCCKYCGGRILVNDEARLQAKIRLKELEKEAVIAQFNLEKERILMEQQKMKIQKESQLSTSKIILLILTCIGAGVVMRLFGSLLNLF